MKNKKKKIYPIYSTLGYVNLAVWTFLWGWIALEYLKLEETFLFVYIIMIGSFFFLNLAVFLRETAARICVRRRKRLEKQ